MRGCAAAVVGLALAGCASTPGHERVAQGQRALAEARVCCSSLREAVRAPLPVERKQVDIDSNVQAFEFGGTKAFFVLYELPAFARTWSLTISSVPSGQATDAALLIPRVTTYDAEFRPTRTFDENTLRSRGNTVERTVHFNAVDQHDRYLAIYGSDLSSSVDRAYSIVQQRMIPVGPVLLALVEGSDASVKLRAAPTGTVVIETDGLAAR